MLKYILILSVIFVGIAILPAHASTEFTPFQNISNSPNDSVNPFVVTDGKNIFITWSEFSNANHSADIHFSKSTDGGITFSTPKNISNQHGSSIAPFIHVDESTIFITWTYRYQDDHYSEIYFSKSTDGGITFSDPQKISDATFSYSSRLVTDDKNIFVTWSDITFSNERHYENMEVFFSKSTDGGVTFSSPMNLSNNKEFSSYSSIVTVGKDIFITWTDSTTTGSWIVFSKSTDGGITFSAPQKISNENGFSDAQSIITDGKTVFTAWNYRLKMESQYDIIFSKSKGMVNSTENNSEKISDDYIDSKIQSDIANKPEPENKIELTPLKSLKWIDENDANYSVNGLGVFRLDNSELNVNKELIDIPVVHVWSDTDPKGIMVDVIETGADTGVFYADISLVTEPSSHLSLQVSNGDSVTVSFDDNQTFKLTDTVKIASKNLSPLKQIEFGISPDEITCKEGLELLIKTDHRHHPICVTPDTKSKMIQRGLAMTIQTAN
ncbi:sialidase family protein [Nitrosarchaeum sp. AC2]|uniref:sialidase family protein n=1 Tax=Nitrosarchaeum sp. AC2 TaxID=2259673 RepID=UPI0015CA55CA|nr:sialidase family protein [Nitrosarchaeum sp. AC2]